MVALFNTKEDQNVTNIIRDVLILVVLSVKALQETILRYTLMKMNLNL